MCLTLVYNNRESDKRLYFINFAGIPETLPRVFILLNI
jgi:hypothetical protein